MPAIKDKADALLKEAEGIIEDRIQPFTNRSPKQASANSSDQSHYQSNVCGQRVRSISAWRKFNALVIRIITMEWRSIIDLAILTIGAYGVLFVHELAHVIAARRYGVRVLTVAVGFGPQFFSITDRFGTRWTIAVLPVVGSTSFYDRLPGSGKTKVLPVSACLCDKSVFQRMAIYALGPIASLAFAGLIFTFVLFFYGADLVRVNLTHPPIAISLLISGLSFSLALFNLFPVAPLDGGQISLLAFELVCGRPVSASLQMKMKRAGMLLTGLGGFLVALTVAWLLM